MTSLGKFICLLCPFNIMNILDIVNILVVLCTDRVKGQV